MSGLCGVLASAQGVGQVLFKAAPALAIVPSAFNKEGNREHLRLSESARALQEFAVKNAFDCERVAYTSGEGVTVKKVRARYPHDNVCR